MDEILIYKRAAASSGYRKVWPKRPQRSTLKRNWTGSWAIANWPHDDSYHWKSLKITRGHS